MKSLFTFLLVAILVACVKSQEQVFYRGTSCSGGSHTCYYGATCVGGVVCDCENSYSEYQLPLYGPECDIPGNCGGICCHAGYIIEETGNPGFYGCQCDEDYFYGTFCEHITCENGGTPLDAGDGTPASCICPPDAPDTPNCGCQDGSCGLNCHINGTQCILREYFLTEGSDIPWGHYSLPRYDPVADAPCDLPGRIVRCEYDGTDGNVVRLIFNADFAVVELSISEMLAGIYTLKNLEYKGANLTGSLPTIFGQLSELEVLIVKDIVGDFSSTFNNSFQGLSSVYNIDLGAGHFYGNLSESGLVFQNAGYLATGGGMVSYNLSFNEFYGQIPASAIGTNIFSLDLSHNNLSGTIPSSPREEFCNTILPSSVQPGDLFGNSVYSSAGNFLAISSPGFNNSKGRVLVYNCPEANNCTLIVTLTDPAGQDDDNYGQAISFSQGVLAITSPNKNSSRGAFFMYQCDEQNCTAYSGNPYVGTGVVPGCGFGSSIAVSEIALVAIGAPALNGRGAVYIYLCNPLSLSCAESTYSHLTELSTGYGYSVSIYTNILAVSSVDSSTGTPLFYVYTISSTHHTAFNGNPYSTGGETYMGYADTVYMCGYLLITGGYYQGYNSTGMVNSFFCIEGDCTPSPSNPIVNPDQSIYAGAFGQSISCNGNFVSIGAPGIFGQDAGATYLYTYNQYDTSLTYFSTFEVAGGQITDSFGYSVSFLDIPYLAVSSPYHQDSSGIVYLVPTDLDQPCVPTPPKPGPIKKSDMDNSNLERPSRSIYPYSNSDSSMIFDLSYNNLTGTVPAAFLGLAQLDAQYIVLSYNNLSGPLDFSQFHFFSPSSPYEIQLLLLDNNPNFGGTLPTEIGMLSNLVSFDMTNCGLTGEARVDQILPYLPHLRFFAAPDNFFSGNVQNIVNAVKDAFYEYETPVLNSFYIFHGYGFDCPYPYRDVIWNNYIIQTDYPAYGDYQFLCINCAYPLQCNIGDECISVTTANDTVTLGAYNCTACEVEGSAGYLCNYTTRDVAIYSMQRYTVCDDACGPWGPAATLMRACQNPLFQSQCNDNGGVWGPGFYLDVINMPIQLFFTDYICQYVSDLGSIFFLGLDSVLGIPDTLYLMQNLTQLTVEAPLYGTISSEWGRLQKLTELHLADMSHVTGTIPHELSNIPYLDALILVNGPGVTGTIPTELFSPHSPLRFLVISRLSVSGGLSVIDTYLDKKNSESILYFLVIESTNVGGSLPKTLHQYPYLSHILLDENRFTGYIPTEYGYDPVPFQEYLGTNLLSGNVNYYVTAVASYLLNSTNPTVQPPAPPPRSGGFGRKRRSSVKDFVDFKKQERKHKRSSATNKGELLDLFSFMFNNNFTCAYLPLDPNSAQMLFYYTDFLTSIDPISQSCGPCPNNPSICSSQPGTFCQSFSQEGPSSSLYSCVDAMHCDGLSCGLYCTTSGNPCRPLPCE